MILQKPRWGECRVPSWLEVTLRIFQFVDSIVSPILWVLCLQANGSKGMAGQLHAVLGILVAANLWALPMISDGVAAAFQQAQCAEMETCVMHCIATVVLDIVLVILIAAAAGVTGKMRCTSWDSIAEDHGGDDNDDDNEVRHRRIAAIFAKGQRNGGNDW